MPTMGSCNDAKWQESKLLLPGPIANDIKWWYRMTLTTGSPSPSSWGLTSLQKIVLQSSSWRKFNHFDPAKNGWLFRPSFWVLSRIGHSEKGSPWAGENIRECSEDNENQLVFYSTFLLIFFQFSRWHFYSEGLSHYHLVMVSSWRSLKF